jgi:L-threonylcarbamoyladenylate synthase
MARILRFDPGLFPPEEALREAAQAVRGGGVGVVPTDTVYGIGASAWERPAVLRIYRIKGRDSMKPLPILVHSRREALRWALWTPEAEALAGRFWPGPLTLVLRATSEGRRLSGGGSETIALRVPAHEALLAAIERSGVPWASTSANRSGLPALADGASAAREFERDADLVIDGGALPGTESTVADASGPGVRVLREGAVPRGGIEEVSAGKRR